MPVKVRPDWAKLRRRWRILRRRSQRDRLVLGAIAGVVLAVTVSLLWWQRPWNLNDSATSALVDLQPQETAASLLFSADQGDRLFRSLASEADWLKQLPADFLEPLVDQASERLLLWLPSSQTPIPGLGTQSLQAAIALELTQPELLLDRLQVLERQQQWRIEQRSGQSLVGRLGDRYSLLLLRNRYLVLSESDATLRRLLSAYLGEGSLTQTADYQRLCGSTPATELRLYFDWPVLQSASTQAGDAWGLPPVAEAACADFVTQSEGIQIQGKALTESETTASTSPQPPRPRQELRSQVPAETVLWFESVNLAQFWQAISGGPIALQLPSGQQFDRDFEALTSTQLQRDWLSWSQGSYAIGVVQNPNPANQSQPRAGLILLVQASNRRQAEQSWQKLDEHLKKTGQLKVVPARGSTLWQLPDGRPIARHGWLRNNVSFLTVAAGTTLTLPPPSDRPSLATTPTAALTGDGPSDRLILKLTQLRQLGLLPLPKLLQDRLQPFDQLHLQWQKSRAGVTPFELWLTLPPSDSVKPDDAAEPDN
ncbi:DUF3352 domain-containing protein [Synechococcus elongatus]|uniref:DUF3352 domain-containing protein n=2 Tax=Synechococcus elongatus TaxID=32046 RepID=Q31QF0_SYNE7|nr:DUF3352 domain-containing protein [Synechococcus elongatus]ABB56719.1 hypothetical protein Synpcc7942_0687 [Synechococcus elongatus PCC 7942 = FACHB-805]AJD58739.1 hypothetical protein M744_13355 [Synechococcus elongatus UTEX 2973]MBD2588579.1 DUF3352 domain-containing protein [Synechococcus elongatus FACHB-242]MBD2689832.1 DUF3352 domain-containing protein [Synechococcus elongatus FACHB-1061]MBD2708439.1 DUF3352 domain-containing protein [Synechococcus elongatus PCC 7942 = FACHB-805]